MQDQGPPATIASLMNDIAETSVTDAIVRGAGPDKLFVFGVPRSGTTAMAELLNRHPAICIGIERYKKLLRNARRVAGDEFEFERFFDFREGDTNILPRKDNRYAAIYDEMREKYRGASLVGDKIPNMLQMVRPLQRIFPGARFIYMLRDIWGVAASWDARAKNPKDAWPVTNDYAAAVQWWNKTNKGVADGLENASGLHIVHYSDFFAGEGLDKLQAFLGLEPSEAFALSYGETCEKYVALQAKKSGDVPDEKRAFIEAHADFATYEQVKRFA